MIACIIEFSMKNRFMLLLLTARAVGAPVWSSVNARLCKPQPTETLA